MASKRELMKQRNAALIGKTAKPKETETTNFVDELIDDLPKAEEKPEKPAKKPVEKANPEAVKPAPKEVKAEKETPAPEKKEAPASEKSIKLVLENKNEIKKTYRTRSFYLLDANYEKLQELSESHGRSVSDILNDILSQVL